MLKRIDAHNRICPLICVRTKLTDSFHSLPTCFLARSFEYSFSNIDPDDAASTILREGNCIASITASKIDNHLSSKQVENVVTQQHLNFDFSPVDLAGHVSRFARRDPMEDPVLQPVQSRIQRLWHTTCQAAGTYYRGYFGFC